MSARRILALVLAGGKGTRLHPLTAEHAKPALPFAGGYRIVDFVLSNLINSSVSPVYVLAQYKPESLIEHLRAAWSVAPDTSDSPIKVILPRREAGPDGFRGSADAIYQNLHVVERHKPDLVAVFAADHVYRMDVGQMAEFHEARDADATIAAVPVPVAGASSFGVIVASAGGRVEDFQEKPKRPVAIPVRPSHAYVSMGNYLFEPKVLAQALRDVHRRGEDDFGHHVLPPLSRSHRCYAYDFTANRVPGVQPYEERSYWRDVGTVEAYLEAQADVAGRRPRFQLWNPHWPIRGQRPSSAEGHCGPGSAPDGDPHSLSLAGIEVTSSTRRARTTVTAEHGRRRASPSSEA
jgi:glucose-1-phosphate adenylyltransferase